MIRCYMTENKVLTPIDAPGKGCWISLIAPTEEEILWASEKGSVDEGALRAALDPEERSRIETDENCTMILVNIPTIVTANEKELYDTIPLSVILTADSVITVCSQHSPILRQFEENKVRDFHTAEYQLPSFCKPVNIISVSYTHGLSFLSNALAIIRSSGVVIFMLR